MEKQTTQVWLSDKAVANRYDIARVTVWSWVRKGILPPPKKLGPNTSRWSAAELDRRDQEVAA